MRINIKIPEIDRVNVNLLREAGVDIDAVCREAIVNRVRELDLQRKFVIGDYIRITIGGHYHNQWGEVVGYHRKRITILLDDRRMVMMFPDEIEHREYQDA